MSHICVGAYGHMYAYVHMSSSTLERGAAVAMQATETATTANTATTILLLLLPLLYFHCYYCYCYYHHGSWGLSAGGWWNLVTDLAPSS